MKRKQRKLLPWRRFGYLILIIIKFCEILLWISPRIINASRSYMKHSRECFIRYQNTLKLVKKTRLAPRFSTHYSAFGYLMKRSSLCLIYYFIIWNHNERSVNLRFICTETSDRVQRECKTEQKEIPESKKDHHQTTQQEQSGSNTSHSIVLTEKN